MRKIQIQNSKNLQLNRYFYSSFSQIIFYPKFATFFHLIIPKKYFFFDVFIKNVNLLAKKKVFLGVLY